MLNGSEVGLANKVEDSRPVRRRIDLHPIIIASLIMFHRMALLHTTPVVLNQIDAFATAATVAAGFVDIRHRRPSFVLSTAPKASTVVTSVSDTARGIFFMNVVKMAPSLPPPSHLKRKLSRLDSPLFASTASATTTTTTPEADGESTTINASAGEKKDVEGFSNGTNRSSVGGIEDENAAAAAAATVDVVDVPLYRSEGLFAVSKPLEWTSQDVVSYCRGILERDARGRGAKVEKLGRKRKKNTIKIGHGGTLDPLATGVLVIGVGKGTKELQAYLDGSKKYRASVELGYETETLDKEGNVTRTAPLEHVTLESIRDCLPSFTGKIMQIPPAFSAIKKDGKKMYREARKGKTAEELGISAREVEVYRLDLLSEDDEGRGLPCFGLDVECGGGTYIRSLVRDIGQELGSAATMTGLVRTKQGQFTLEQTLLRQDWTADNIFAAIDSFNTDR